MGKVFRGIPERHALKLKKQFDLPVFIETGTFRGRTARWATGYFDRVYTIEIDPGIYSKASNELSFYKNIETYLGDSRTVLVQILDKVNKPALIWLDAHWSIDLKTEKPLLGECPVLEEIEAINSSPVKSVVLIDDARYFINPPPKEHNQEQWPTYDLILDKFGSGWDVSYIENLDIIQAIS